MKYAIMCGGDYSDRFSTPKQLVEVKGEKIAARTVRLLQEAGAEDVVVLANNPAFDCLGVPRIENPENDYVHGTDKLWLNAFYPFFCEVCFIFGDVYFSQAAIETIVNDDHEGNVLFGSAISANKAGKNWGEPFAYIVRDFAHFWEAREAVIDLYYWGKLKRHPIAWEVYRYENGLDVNVQAVKEETFVIIDDGTIDLDSPEQVGRL